LERACEWYESNARAAVYKQQDGIADMLNKTQMQANKLQFRSPGFEALPGYRRWGDDLLAPDTRRSRPSAL
jgi:hypothetical protein